MTEPIPQRIGRAERDAALTQLRGQYEAGKLTVDEFDERSAKITDAKIQADLDVLFADIGGLSTWKTLPTLGQPVYPGQEVAPAQPLAEPASAKAPAVSPALISTAPTTPAGKIAGTIAGVIWPVMLALAFFGVLPWWPAIGIAIVVSAVAGTIRANFGTK